MNKKLIITVLSISILAAFTWADAKLTFTSDQPFAATAPKGWSGSMESSTNSSDWSTWDGTNIHSAIDASSGKYVLHFRGSGNNNLSKDDLGTWKSWTLEGESISCFGNIEALLDYAEVEKGNHPEMAMNCFRAMFSGCTNLVCTPELPAVTLAVNCYYDMFKGCTLLEDLPVLPGTNLVERCYFQMFMGCTNIYLSTTAQGKAWSLPLSARVVSEEYNKSMFKNAGNEYLDTVTTNKTYYLSRWKVALLSDWVSLAWTNRQYSATVQKPEPTVNDGSRGFVLGTDYTRSYSNSASRDIGLYTVTVTGKNTYTGDVVRTYAIVGVIDPSSGATVVTNAATSVEEAKSTVVLTPPAAAEVSEADYRLYFTMDAKPLANNLYEITISLDANKLDLADSVRTFATNLQSIATAALGDYALAGKPGLYYGVSRSSMAASGYTSDKKSLAKTDTVAVRVVRPSATNGFFKVDVSATSDK